MKFILFLWVIMLTVLFICGVNYGSITNLKITDPFPGIKLAESFDAYTDNPADNDDNTPIVNKTNEYGEIDLGPNNALEEQQKLIENTGWWSDTINCSKNSSPNIYCKPMDKWIWPY